MAKHIEGTPKIPAGFVQIPHIALEASWEVQTRIPSPRGLATGDSYLSCALLVLCYCCSMFCDMSAVLVDVLYTLYLFSAVLYCLL